MTAEILDDLFHSCSLEAFVTLARERQGWPDGEEVRRLAYRLYERYLAEKNAAKDQPPAEGIAQ